MTPRQVQLWFAQMGRMEQFSKLSPSHLVDALSAELGIDRTSLYALRKRGGSKRDALACAALLNGIKPYGEE